MFNKFHTRENHFILAEYADLSTCTTFVSGVNVQASNQLASCEGARVVILCDINDDDDIKEQTKVTDALSSSENSKYLSKFQTLSRAISLYGRYCKEVLQG